MFQPQFLQEKAKGLLPRGNLPRGSIVEKKTPVEMVLETPRKIDTMIERDRRYGPERNLVLLWRVWPNHNLIDIPCLRQHGRQERPKPAAERLIFKRHACCERRDIAKIAFGQNVIEMGCTTSPMADDEDWWRHRRRRATALCDVSLFAEAERRTSDR